MSRAKFNNEWFFRLSDDAHLEIEFERLIQANAGLLSESAIVVPFKQTVSADGLPDRRPDLALVDRQYRFWWVIEVEIATHSLGGHVLPQVQTFVEGRYGPDHARALKRAEDGFNYDKLLAMMSGEQPEVVVIANRHIEAWERGIRNEGAHFCVMDVFRSENNRDIFVFDGRLPTPDLECLTELVPSRVIPSMYRVKSPGSLPQTEGNQIVLLIGVRKCSFTIHKTATDWFLLADQVRLKQVSYEIRIDSNRGLILEEVI